MGIFNSILIVVKSILRRNPRYWGTFKCILINGCDAGSVGASLALTLAESSVRVFACSTTLSAMSGLQDHPNVTAMVLDPTSLSDVDTTLDTVRTLLNGETLSMLVNAGNVGLEPPSGSFPEDAIQRYNIHLFTARRLALAFKDLLATSHGAIINLTSVEMLEHERSITNHPATTGGILDVTNFLRARLAPYDVKVLTVIHEAEGPGSGMVSDTSGSWRDISALTEDILRDMFRLPGYDRAL